MPGVLSTGCPPTKPAVRRAHWFLLALLIGLGPAPVPAQEVSPTVPAATTDPTAPLLPTDPTSPATTGTSGAPSIPLIPAQPLAPVQPTPGANASLFAPAAARALPAALPAELFPPPSVGEVPPVTGATTTNNIGTARRFQYNFALTLGATFDDNIFLESGSTASSDLYFTVQPSVALGLGGGLGGGAQDNSVRFSYSPQALLYVDHPELDTVQHFVALRGVYNLARTTLTGSLGVQILDNTDVGNPHPFEQTASAGTTGNPPFGGPIVNTPSSSVNLDTSQRTRLNLYTASLAANYFVSDKVSYDLSGQLSDSDYQSLLSSTALSGSIFFNYSPTGKTTAGLGGTVGYVFAERPTPDQSFEQADLRLTYTPSSKLAASGQLGLELRQSSAQSGSEVTPIFELSASYLPFDGTAITLAGNRQVLTSAVLGGQDYTITGFTLSLSQRFIQRLYARVSLGYSHTEYVSELTHGAATRADDYLFVQPGLDFNVRDNLTIGGFYSFRSSTSTQSGRDFTDNQVGLRLSLSF